MNPFDQDTFETLYNITTGASIASDIKDDPLGFLTKGQELYAHYTEEAFVDQTRFEKPTSRRKIQDFVIAAGKNTVITKDQKVVELKRTRDLFGRQLYISTLERIDVEKVFQYPLIPISLALAHVDGSINKTDKANRLHKLLYKLEGMVENEKPGYIDVTLIYVVFLVHTLLNLPATFGGVAEVLLRRLCQMSPRIDIVYNTYIAPSIKEAERIKRGNNVCCDRSRTKGPQN
ncbi:hypothetical protein LSH36_2312g00001 [Paralvinella palmiformis]|uniref:Uncharacterized protein n=1 Tax=Paralvinella palmiformis TaxID=53620 RepID=A0AAD9IRE1_9ANNE|nr:hypothetical protein LSH36_2312g00001 [Paralvinella palmiformis]